ncbi:hypothetical protein TREMEDRAFT_60193 [Tremella mesenterica DSM 1558]|uniref:uncharacterized protein n=1 Tax=Tremella mesenterica (strain ATCC 24925 / CBS 8224 / DSM 1558 / NBRC 9311 / NRRL Y-6157 / RJB 2259-6 / UBC 559-6) TaxID=578456 RepID=UPI0003F4A02D|nr:uncharacterized protein TREMEDRAFT_60193 [Tremella mesenterica DSM 1558]EIW71262.1 hypothetical protein TREMEDRAFT_60193 [Tremella mesenterica DSM 1558]
MGARYPPSSPLNPYPSSSSPLTSPTPPPGPSVYRPFSTLAQPFSPSLQLQRRSPTSQTPTRFARPSQAGKQRSSPGITFTAEGTTPTESAMWRQAFTRRMEERVRRKKAREEDLARRRNMKLPQEEDVFDEEAERQAQNDEEEIFRRLMVLQRRREERAQLAAEEWEGGGSDPVAPEFWDEIQIQHTPRPIIPLRPADITMGHEPQTPPVARPWRPVPLQSVQGGHSVTEEIEEERWAREAAEAEEAEFEAEEAELARLIEEEYYRQLQAQGRRSEAEDDAMDLS